MRQPCLRCGTSASTRRQPCCSRMLDKRLRRRISASERQTRHPCPWCPCCHCNHSTPSRCSSSRQGRPAQGGDCQSTPFIPPRCGGRSVPTWVSRSEGGAPPYDSTLHLYPPPYGGLQGRVRLLVSSVPLYSPRTLRVEMRGTLIDVAQSSIISSKTGLQHEQALPCQARMLAEGLRVFSYKHPFSTPLTPLAEHPLSIPFAKHPLSTPLAGGELSICVTFSGAALVHTLISAFVAMVRDVCQNEACFPLVYSSTKA
jgi:hypothetical protein